MKRILILTLLLLQALMGTAGATLPATDTFTGADNDPLSSDWTVLNANNPFTILGNTAQGTANSCEFWNADSFGANQSSQCTITADAAGPGVRLSNSGGGGRYGYIAYLDIGAQTISFFKSVNAAWAIMSSAIPVTASLGDQVKLTITGYPGTLEVFLNHSGAGFISQGTAAGDAGITGGAPGIYAYLGAVDNWQGDNIYTVGVPTVTTQAVTPASITETTATGNGTITDLGGSTVTAWGICVNTTGTPTTADTVFSGSGTGALGAFTADLTGLSQSTKYYVRAFATNTTGTGYGTQVTFVTPPINYYFDAVSGNSSNDGMSVTTPKQTLADIQSVIDAGLSPDDTLNLKEGTAPGQQVWVGLLKLHGTTGTSGHPVTIQSYVHGDAGGVKPEIRTATDITGNSWTLVGDVYQTTGVTDPSCQYFAWENGAALPQGANTTLSTGGNWFYSSGTFYYKPTSGTIAGKIIEVDSNQLDGSILDKSLSGDGAGGNDYITIDGIYFSRMGLRSDAHGNTHQMIGWTLKNCTFKTCGAEFTHDTIYSWTDLLIQDNTFSYCVSPDYNAGSSINLEGQPNGGYGYTNLQVLNNTILHNNTIESTGLEWFVGWGDNDCIPIQGMLINCKIIGNKLSGFCGANAGITYYIPKTSDRPGTTSTGHIVSKNYFHDLSGDGFRLQGGNGVVGANITFTNNILARITGNAIGLNQVQSSILKSLVANNTIYNVGTGFDLESNADYFVLENNIIHTAGAYVFIYGAGTHNILDYNCWYNSSTGFIYPAGTKNFAGWQADGYDPHGKAADPLFINAGGSYQLPPDFQVPWSSPTKNGTNVGLTTDYWGSPVPTGSPSRYFMGSFQPAAVANVSGRFLGFWD